MDDRRATLRVGIDVGGTFTDFVVSDPGDGSLQSFKIPSTHENPARGVVEGLQRLESSEGEPRRIVHGSTVATNAILERRGSPTALVTTAGFRDLLAIGRQVRPHLYDLFADPPPPLVPPERSFEVRERVGAEGEILEPLAESSVEELVADLRRTRAESVAVSLLFSFLRPEHERRIADRLREAGYRVSVSHEVLPEFREYERTSTTTADAYVGPVLDRYLEELEAALEREAGSELRVMLSHGGIARAGEVRRHAVRAVLSGPAAGVVGALYVAREAGFEGALTFDMGGTSTDVSLAPDRPALTTEGEIGGIPIRVPMLDIHTVGSGGGSIARVDAGGALRVGPESAGSHPGPACYGFGGRVATVTDANVVLGRLPPDLFLGGRMPLDRDAATAALARLAAEAGLKAEGGLSPAEVAALGVVRVANAHMERALRRISVERGHDPADFPLVSFGGAGGLHAGELARRIGARTVYVPRAASTLSALGLLAAPVVRDAVLTVMLPGNVSFAELERRASPLAEAVVKEVRTEGVPEDDIRLDRQVDVRYAGQSYELSVPLVPGYAARFHETHRHAYGHADPGAPIEIVNLRARAVGRVPAPPLPAAGREELPSARLARRPVVLPGPASGVSGRRVEVPLFRGGRLRAGSRIEGPAVVVLPDSTLFVPPDTTAQVDSFGGFHLALGETGRA